MIKELNKYKLNSPINIDVFQNIDKTFTVKLKEAGCFELTGHGNTENDAINSLKIIIEVMYVDLNKTDKNIGEWLELKNLLNTKIIST